jgi:serine/threonine protein kinase
MKPERWQQLDKLFQSALEREPEQRAAFLDGACAGDEALRREVESLLAASKEAGSFIERPALEVEARSLADEQGNVGAESMVGKTIGHYRVIALLGLGGMGEVYLAQDNVLGRKVALKLLPAYFTKDTDRLRRFEQEARAASALNHPNIVTIHEIGHDGSFHFIAQEFVEGVTLRTYLGGKRLAFDEALDISMQVASALAAAHAKGMVHRDLKPENMMVHEGSHLGRQNHVKLLDFGIAKLADVPGTAMKAEATTRLLIRTDEGRAIGTAAYMSPEQARGEKVDARTDTWSLGVVLYEMVTGKQPFAGDTSQDVIASILRDDLPPLPSESPEGLKWILKKALRKVCEERYQTARELFSDLQDLHKQETQSSDVSLGPENADGTETGTAVTHETPGVPTGETTSRQTSIAASIIGEFRPLSRSTILWLTVIIIAVAGITFGLYKLLSNKTSQVKSVFPFQTMKIARLTSTGMASAAAISPDGKYVAHVVVDGGQQSIWLRQVSNSSNVQISQPANAAYNGLAFSPSGEYLYYVASDRTMPNTLYQMPTLGGLARKLITDIDSVVTFSPDGKQFAFVRGDAAQGKFAVVIANADGTAERKLTTSAMGNNTLSDPAWSPDGKVIVFTAENTNAMARNLFAVQVADGAVKPISSQPWWRIGTVAWLSDGSGLVFTATESFASLFQIWYLSYPDGQVHRITNDLNDYLSLSLSAHSVALVTVKSERVSNIWIVHNDDFLRASQITNNKFDGVEGISWTPDNKIVYTSSASDRFDLWIMEANGKGQKQLTADAGNNRQPSVSFDGRYVVFMSDRTGSNHIWRIDIDGSNPRQLTDGEVEWYPQCSPTDGWVFFMRHSSGKTSLSKVSINGGEPIQIVDQASGGIAISPDSKWIASARLEPGGRKAAIYPIEGGEPSKMLDIVTRYACWTPDGQALAYVDRKNFNNITRQPIDGSPPKQLTDFKPDRVFTFSWSRDGKQLAIARGNVSQEVVLISNFKDQ